MSGYCTRVPVQYDEYYKVAGNNEQGGANDNTPEI